MLAAKKFLAVFASTGDVTEIESAALQLRKALETIAFAVIAPDKKRYATFRAMADKSADFRRDYHAKTIFLTLGKVNKDFYPKALTPAEKQPDGSWHFGQKQSGFLSKKKFENAYDRLGKHLHAHNPWSGSKNLQNLAADLPVIIEEAHGLLDLHARFIRAPGYEGVWIFEADRLGNQPRLITANSTAPYVVT